MKTPVYVDLWYSATWNDITSDVRATPEHQIMISGGQQNWLSRVSPTKCDLALINTIIHPGESPTKIGKYSSRNPMSPLYGLIGRNTPLRVYVRWLADDFGRTVASGWGTSASHLDSNNKETAVVGSKAWTTTGSGAGASAVGSGVATHTQTDANGFRLSYLASGANIRDCEVRAVVTADEANIDGGNIQPGNLVLRLIDANNYYYVRVQVTTAEVVQIGLRKVVAGVDSEIAAPVTVDALTYSGQQLGVAFLADGPHLAAKVWAASAGEVFAWQITATDTSLPAAGAPGVRSGVASGNSDVPVIFTYDNLEVRSYRFCGEVEAFPQEWTLDADEDGRGVVWAPLVAYGLMYRLGLPGQAVLAQSALRRALDALTASNAPYAWWPLDTGLLSESQAAAAGSGTDAELIQSKATGWGQHAMAPWLEPGVQLDEGSRVNNRGMTMPATPTGWSVDFVWAGSAGQTVVHGRNLLDNVAIRFELAMTAGAFNDVEIHIKNNGVNVGYIGVLGLSVAQSGYPFFDDRAHHVRVQADQNGANIDWSLYIDGQLMEAIVGAGSPTTPSATSTYTTAGLTLNGIDRVNFLHDASGTDTGPAGVLHVLVWPDSPPAVADLAVAMGGYAGETADARVARVCAEEGIQAFVTGTGQAMGPQPIAPPLEMFVGSGEVRDVDGGVFGEPRHTLGFGFTATSSLLNQDPTLTLDYASAEVAPPLLHREDLDHCQNDVTVTRRDGGSSARLLQETGPLNVSAPHTDPNGVGHYPVRPELNLASDAQLANTAGWLRMHGTTDGLRFAALAVDLTALYRAGKVGLIGDVLAVDPGDMIAVENLPAWLGGGDTQQIQRGFTEQLGPFHWVTENVTGPYEPYRVGQYEADAADGSDDPEPNRYDTAGCETAQGLWLPGTPGSYASTPDNAALDITGDIQIAVECLLSDWTGTHALMTKWQNSGNNLSYWFGLIGGKIQLWWTTGGTGGTAKFTESTVVIPAPIGGRLALIATLDVNNGAGGNTVTFYTAADMGAAFVQLGSPVVNSGTTSIFSGSAPVEVGSADGGGTNARGIIAHTEIRNGIAGTVVTNPHFETKSPGTSSFADSSGRTWTINGSAVTYGDDFETGTDTKLAVITTLGPPWTQDADDLPMTLRCSGAVLEVTAVEGAGLAQILTVSSTVVNGVTKTIPEEESITVARPVPYAL